MCSHFNKHAYQVLSAAQPANLQPQIIFHHY